MARIYPLFSSSKGNSIYFGDENGGVLIDCGVSCKRLTAALNENGLSPDRIKAVFITHTHSDHISGLKVFIKKYGTPVYALRKNLEILAEKEYVSESCERHEIDGKPAEISGFTVSHFPTPHDAPASCGYRITYPDGKAAALCTDLGYITDEVSAALKGTDLVLIESNHDRNMLKNGCYPDYLKERILSDHGHLSNEQCGETLKRLADNNTAFFVLGHLSQENNTPGLAEQNAVNALLPLVRQRDYMLYIAPPSGGKAIVF